MLKNLRVLKFMRLFSVRSFRAKTKHWPVSLTSAATSLALCTLSLIATFVISFLIYRNIQNERSERFDRLTRRTVMAIRNRMMAYENALEHARALLVTEPDASHEQFHAFVSAMILATQYPGLQALSYIVRVPKADLHQFKRMARSEVSSEYVLWPPGERSESWPVLYIEPPNWRNRRTLGFDLLTDPDRESAIRAAIDKAGTTLSRRVTLTQETNVGRQPGFLMLVPIYKGGSIPATVAQRRSDVIGFICGGFRTIDLFNQITQELGIARLANIRVYDSRSTADAQTILYDSEALHSSKETTHKEPGTFTAATTIDVSGEPWTISVNSLKSFDQEISLDPVWFVLSGGMLISGLFFLLGRTSIHLSRSLIQNENQLRLVTDSLPVLVARFNADGVYEFANASHADWFGVESSELKGRSFKDFIGNCAGPRESTFFAQALSGQAVNFESVVQHCSLGLRQVKIDCIPESSESPATEQHGFVAYALDITEQAGLVRALKRSESLYRDIARQNERLYRESRSLNRSKDEFLTTLSHELRTPLTVILGHADLLKKQSGFAEEVSESINSIARNARAQTQIINDLIDVSSMVTGKLSLQIHAVAIDEIVRTTIERFRSEAADKHLRVNDEVRGLNTLIMGDALRLEQILTNLLTNSIKFTPAGGTINITACANGSTYEIELADNGQGIDREFLPYIFDRFRQEDNSVTRSFGGLGLGLAIVSNLVEAHGGQVSASSEGQGKGSSFVVRFPLLELNTSTSALRKKSLATTTPKPRPRSGTLFLESARVLVVDDESDTRKLISRYLERAGAHVMMASSAQGAIEVFKDFNPELVVSDIGMPVEDGYSLIRRIRNLEKQLSLPPVPAIALTAFARAEDRMRAIRSGFHVHLTKPVTADRLTEASCALLSIQIEKAHSHRQPTPAIEISGEIPQVII